MSGILVGAYLITVVLVFLVRM